MSNKSVLVLQKEMEALLKEEREAALEFERVEAERKSWNKRFLDREGQLKGSLSLYDEQKRKAADKLSKLKLELAVASQAEGKQIDILSVPVPVIAKENRLGIPISRATLFFEVSLARLLGEEAPELAKKFGIRMRKRGKFSGTPCYSNLITQLVLNALMNPGSLRPVTLREVLDRYGRL